jgi:Integrase core domain
MAVRAWLEARRIGTHDIDSGSPWQNAYNERLNSRFRPTCLDRWAFASVSEARAVSRQWLEEYNTSRPHGSLAGRSPVHPSAGWRGSNNDDEAELPNLNLRTKDRGLDNMTSSYHFYLFPNHFLDRFCETKARFNGAFSCDRSGIGLVLWRKAHRDG